eukprot:Hpha_TRINITY_DN29791_c0_g1::TRINITY_DN29791_c0_g1_i1::g.2516::m.2516
MGVRNPTFSSNIPPSIRMRRGSYLDSDRTPSVSPSVGPVPYPSVQPLPRAPTFPPSFVGAISAPPSSADQDEAGIHPVVIILLNLTLCCLIVAFIIYRRRKQRREERAASTQLLKDTVRVIDREASMDTDHEELFVDDPPEDPRSPAVPADRECDVDLFEVTYRSSRQSEGRRDLAESLLSDGPGLQELLFDSPSPRGGGALARANEMVGGVGRGAPAQQHSPLSRRSSTRRRRTSRYSARNSPYSVSNAEYPTSPSLGVRGRASDLNFRTGTDPRPVDSPKLGEPESARMWKRRREKAMASVYKHRGSVDGDVAGLAATFTNQRPSPSSVSRRARGIANKDSLMAVPRVRSKNMVKSRQSSTEENSGLKEVRFLAATSGGSSRRSCTQSPARRRDEEGRAHSSGTDPREGSVVGEEGGGAPEDP